MHTLSLDGATLTVQQATGGKRDSVASGMLSKIQVTKVS